MFLTYGNYFKIYKYQKIIGFKYPTYIDYVGYHKK